MQATGRMRKVLQVFLLFPTPPRPFLILTPFPLLDSLRISMPMSLAV